MIERGILPEGHGADADQPDAPRARSRRATRCVRGTRCRPTRRSCSRRMAEVYAGFSEYTDAQVGRIIDYLEESGQLDNTIDLLLRRQRRVRRGQPERIGQRGQVLQRLSGRRSRRTWRCSTSSAARTPTTTTRPAGPSRSRRRSGCSSATRYQGGVCDPLVISWPKGIKARGEVRHQYHHCTDIVPDDPRLLRRRDAGGRQRRRADAAAGRFDALHASTTPRRRRRRRRSTTRCSARRGIWHKGWKAVTEHGPISRHRATSTRTAGSCSTPTRTASEAHDLAEQHPEKVEGAGRRSGSRRPKKNNVLPLNDYWRREGPPDVPRDASSTSRSRRAGSTRTTRARREVPERSAANVHGVSYKILAEVEFTQDCAGRDLRRRARASAATRCSSRTGSSLTSTTSSASRPSSASRRRAPASGKHVVGVEFTKERMGEHHESHGPLKLYVDDKVVAEEEIRTMTGHFSLCGEGLCIGYDSGDGVSAASTSRSSRSPAARSSRSSSTWPTTPTSTSSGTSRRQWRATSPARARRIEAGRP